MRGIGRKGTALCHKFSQRTHAMMAVSLAVSEAFFHQIRNQCKIATNRNYTFCLISNVASCNCRESTPRIYHFEPKNCYVLKSHRKRRGSFILDAQQQQPQQQQQHSSSSSSSRVSVVVTIEHGSLSRRHSC